MVPIPVVLAACLVVSATSDRVRAGDLAAAGPAFAALDPDTVIGWAPAPGVQRVFSAAELRRVAARLGAPEQPQADLCIERQSAPLDPARLLAALQALVPEAVLTLIDYSRVAAPEGELMFSRAGLRRVAGGAYIWRGSVRYAGARRFFVWAKITARSKEPVVVAAADLRPGRPIEPAQVRLEVRPELLDAAALRSLDDAIGKWPRRAIRAGAVVAPLSLGPAPQVSRGDTVRVDVWSGTAHLRMDARAEGAAALGEPVPVRNPVTRKRFLARVEGQGRVSVGSSSGPAEPMGPAGKERP
ncbi:MAG TPA: flagellar basal body P-ring formation chaperone FlgA [Bryobacteraceae bacterium]|nr:flagellar basal body P-ring formation chaperone FlgA [Bryobacteraceae bacterium]